VKPLEALRWLRVWLNRLVVALVLVGALAHIAFVGRVCRRRAVRSARRWVLVAARLTGVRFESRGHLGARTGASQVLVANHSSPLDIAALLAVAPDLRFVAGADLFKFPLLGAAMRGLGTVPVDRRSRSASHLEVPGGDLSPEWTLVVFPEGAIPPAGRRLPFKRGAFALAIEKGADVVPVAIHHSARVLPPRGRLGVRPGKVVVEFLSPLSTRGLSHSDRHGLAERSERSVLEALGRGPAVAAGCQTLA
jgi:1-acyl-sn-glycerol-3-phosphate acyltransferase